MGQHRSHYLPNANAEQRWSLHRRYDGNTLRGTVRRTNETLDTTRSSPSSPADGECAGRTIQRERIYAQFLRAVARSVVSSAREYECHRRDLHLLKRHLRRHRHHLHRRDRSYRLRDNGATHPACLRRVYGECQCGRYVRRVDRPRHVSIRHHHAGEDLGTVPLHGRRDGRRRQRHRHELRRTVRKLADMVSSHRHEPHHHALSRGGCESHSERRARERIDDGEWTDLHARQHVHDHDLVSEWHRQPTPLLRLQRDDAHAVDARDKSLHHLRHLERRQPYVLRHPKWNEPRGCDARGHRRIPQLHRLRHYQLLLRRRRGSERPLPNLRRGMPFQRLDGVLRHHVRNEYRRHHDGRNRGLPRPQRNRRDPSHEHRLHHRSGDQHHHHRLGHRCQPLLHRRQWQRGHDVQLHLYRHQHDRDNDRGDGSHHHLFRLRRGECLHPRRSGALGIVPNGWNRVSPTPHHHHSGFTSMAELLHFHHGPFHPDSARLQRSQRTGIPDATSYPQREHSTWRGHGYNA